MGGSRSFGRYLRTDCSTFLLHTTVGNNAPLGPSLGPLIIHAWLLFFSRELMALFAREALEVVSNEAISFSDGAIKRNSTFET